MIPHAPWGHPSVLLFWRVCLVILWINLLMRGEVFSLSGVCLFVATAMAWKDMEDDPCSHAISTGRDGQAIG